MGRPRRFHLPGGLYHVTSRGNRRGVIFEDSTEYQKFESLLKLYPEKFGVSLYAFCLMPNHVHLLVEVGDRPLGDLMHTLLTAYSHWRNALRHQTGHVFQGRYHAVLCDRDEYLLALLRYIHANPLRAQLVSDITEWRWSSLHAYLRHPVSWIATQRAFALMAKEVPRARALLQHLFAEEGERLAKALRYPSTVLGSEIFLAGLPHPVNQPSSRAHTETFPTPQKGFPQVADPVLLAFVSRTSGISVSELLGTGRARRVIRLRRTLAQATQKWWDWTHVKTAALLKKTPEAVLGMRVKNSVASQQERIDRTILRWERWLTRPHRDTSSP